MEDVARCKAREELTYLAKFCTERLEGLLLCLCSLKRLSFWIKQFISISPG